MLRCYATMRSCRSPMERRSPSALPWWVKCGSGDARVRTFSSRRRSSALDGTRFYLLGGAEGVADELTAALRERFPGIQIVGTATPLFVWTDELSRGLVERVRESEADVLWLGFRPRNRRCGRFAGMQMSADPSCVWVQPSISCRAANRALRFGCDEWLFRLLSEPRRLLWRYLGGNAVFLFDLLRYRDKAPE